MIFMKYYVLTDKINKDEIVMKDEKGTAYCYSFGEERWYQSRIMERYCTKGDFLYNQYYEITEKDAENLIEKQREKLMSLLNLAEKTAERLHSGQKDKGGKPYFEHPKAVASFLKNTEYKIVGYLHDVIEDTETTAEDLLEMGFTERIVNSVVLLTKSKEVQYEQYLHKISMDKCACNVKMADLRHNMDISRIPSPTEKDYARLEKYRKAYEFLSNAEPYSI